MKKWGLTALVLASVLYGAFGSPTPDSPSFLEAGIVCLLALATLCGGLDKSVTREPWFKPLAALIVYGALMGSLQGIFAGNTPSDIARDLVAFSALAIPIALWGHRQNARVWLGVLAGIGFAFSCRYLAGPEAVMDNTGNDLLYLANSPLVPFSAAFLLYHGSFVEEGKARAVLCVLLSLIPTLAMAGMMQRATLGLLCALWLVLLAHTFLHAPKRAFMLCAAFAVSLLAFWPQVEGITDALIDKTRAVGWNTRGAELAALIDTQSANPLSALFGAGWGSLFKSPAVGDVWVRFSHSFLSSLWWKTGWIGLLLGVVAIGAVLRSAFLHTRHNPALLFALLLPLVPAIFLYGSYKSLCFGLLLAALVRPDWTLRGRNVNQTPHDRAPSPPLDPYGQPCVPADARSHGQASA
ncbi:MAG: hypothetical protein KGQ41_05680 [Alphaproteobacteria bacterium]|nr:hypothetical protein [Alphaproteobacteria bacterium]